MCARHSEPDALYALDEHAKEGRSCEMTLKVHHRAGKGETIPRRHDEP